MPGMILTIPSHSSWSSRMLKLRHLAHPSCKPPTNSVFTWSERFIHSQILLCMSGMRQKGSRLMSKSSLGLRNNDNFTKSTHQATQCHCALGKVLDFFFYSSKNKCHSLACVQSKNDYPKRILRDHSIEQTWTFIQNRLQRFNP